MADRRLQVFHAVAKQLSFTKAADVLFMTQPAVTFQIKQLEEHFNTRLFDRGHGRIALTPAGEMLVDGIVENFENAVVQAVLIGIADVHAGSLPDGLEALELIDEIEA